MAHGEAVAFELFHNMAANRTRLDASHSVGRIDPQNAVHPAHVDRYYGALLVGGTEQGFGDVRSSAVWNQADVVVLGGSYDRRDLFLSVGIDYEIWYTPQGAVFDVVHLLLSMSVTTA